MLIEISFLLLETKQKMETLSFENKTKLFRFELFLKLKSFGEKLFHAKTSLYAAYTENENVEIAITAAEI